MNPQNGNPFKLRRKNLKERCRENKTDAFLTFDFSDVFYLTGFPSEGCFMLAGSASDALFAPQLLAEHAKASTEGHDLELVSQGPLLKALGKIMKKNRMKKVGFDPAKLTVSLYKEISRIEGVQWVPLDGFILTQRMVKDADEIKAISEACHITHESCMETFKNLETGQTEVKVAHDLEHRFRTRGSEKVAFETIIAFGENAAYPHHVLTSKKLTKNSTVLMDVGSSVRGYKSDLTRTAFFGSITPRFRKIYDIVKKSQAEGMNAVREGVTAGRIDEICREVIRKEGFGDYFIHGTGHGVGIDIHEPPRLGTNSQEVLKENMIVTVEPGIYLPGEFGVRIEDTLLVQKHGSKVLTQ